MLNEWRVIRAVIRKDITEWLHQPRNIFVTFLPSLIFVFILSLSVTAVGRNKVALVVQDNGPHAQQLVSILNDDDAFIITPTTLDQAKEMLDSLKVEAVITVPASFDTAYDAHQADPVTIQINNLNLDFTNDLRRSLPAAITDFYSQQNDTPTCFSNRASLDKMLPASGLRDDAPVVTGVVRTRSMNPILFK